MSIQNIQRPGVYEYDEALKFIEDFVTYLQSAKQLSKNKIVKLAGFKSPSYLDLILKKERALTDLHVDRLCKAFELNQNETQFFHLLGLLTHQESLVSRSLIEEKMKQIRSLHKVRQLDEEELSLFKAWYYPAALIFLGKICPEISELKIEEAFGISKQEASNMIKDLESMKLIEKKGKQWVRSHHKLETPKSPNSEVIRSFHRETLEKALEHLETKPVAERNFQNLVVDLNSQDFKGLSEQIWSFIKQIQNQERKQPDRVYQLSIQLFPLSSSETP